jgi:hypothetical protein
MAIHAGSDADLGEKLKADGSAHPNRIRMYGEQFDLTSNPIQKKTLFAIEAIPRKSGRETAADSVVSRGNGQKDLSTNAASRARRLRYSSC